MGFSTLLLLVLVHFAHHNRAQLLVNFYDTTCPRAESIVKETVTAALAKDPHSPAHLIRLLFHDCFVRGCDGSILLDSVGNVITEKSAPASTTLAGFDIIDQAKATLEQVCKGVVSCADVLALAARDAVAAAGGPKFGMPTGRLDGTTSLASEVSIPDPSFNLDQMLAAFSSKGFQLTDLVILLGAHTIGVARCGAVRNRFPVLNGSMVLDPTMDPSFAQLLIQTCAAVPPPNAVGKGLLTVDEVLFTDPRSKPLVQTFALDANSFMANFPMSFVKLSSLDVKPFGSGQGEVRVQCRFVNTPIPPQGLSFHELKASFGFDAFVGMYSKCTLVGSRLRSLFIDGGLLFW